MVELVDNFKREPPYPPDYLFPDPNWSGLGDLNDLRFLERRLRTERLIPLSYVRLRERLGFALLTMDMQNRWKDAYTRTAQDNRNVLAIVGDLAAAVPQHPILLNGALDAFCTLYPDVGVRPTECFGLFVDAAAWDAYDVILGAHATASAGLGTTDPHTRSYRLTEGIELVLHTTPPVFSTAALLQGSVAASDTPLPSFGGLSITQDAPRLTRDAVNTAEDASRGVVPGRPRAMEKKRGTHEESAAPPRMAGHGNVRLMSREHAFLLAVHHWCQQPDEARSGLLAWELSEMTRRWPLDWNALAAQARVARLHALVGAVLDELAAAWRFEVAPAARAQLRGGPLATLAMRLLGPRRAQHWLLNSPLRFL